MSHARFFGRLREQAGASGRAVMLPAPVSLAEYRALVAMEDAGLLAALSDPVIRVALNGDLLPRGATPSVGPGDEVAFLPPFSGG